MPEIMSPVPSVILGKLTDKNGTTRDITYESFLEMIYEAPHDDNAYDEILIILNAIIAHVSKDPELKKHPDAAANLEELKRIRDYLTRDPTAGALERFLTAESAFLPTPRPSGMEDFMKISAGQDGQYCDLLVGKDDNKVRIRFTGRTGIDEQKITELLRVGVLQNNHYGAKKNYNPWIELPFTEVMKMLGKKDTPANRRKFRSRLMKHILPSVASQSIDAKDRKGNAFHAETGTGEYYINVREDRIYFRVSDTYIKYVNSGGRSLRQTYNKSFYLGSGKNPLPWYLEKKLENHYFADNNRKRNPPTHNILQISTLLEYCENFVPSFELIQETDPGHWIDRIRRPLEAALNEIQKAGIFKWRYCKAKLTSVSTQERSTRNYGRWSQLYINFELIPNEPDQTERLEHKTERIEEAKKKQAVKEAEKIIKADNIKKRGAQNTKQPGDCA